MTEQKIDQQLADGEQVQSENGAVPSGKAEKINLTDDQVSVKVQIKTQDLFRFMFFHSFSKFFGKVILVLALISVIMLPISFFGFHDMYMTMAFLIIVVMYVIVTPLSWLSQAHRQATMNPVFKNPMLFIVSQEQLQIKQYTGMVELDWGRIAKIKQTRYDYLLYVNQNQAYVLPKKCVHQQQTDLLNRLFDQVQSKLGTDIKQPVATRARAGKKHQKASDDEK